MKHFYSIVFLVFCFSAQSQIVNIPDANFKNALINTISAIYVSGGTGDVDANNDGLIQVSEAENVLNLSVESQNINSLAGVEAFVNVEILSCHNNNLISLDLTPLTHLRALACYSNQLTSLNVGNMMNDTSGGGENYINAMYNNLTAFEVPANIVFWGALGFSNNPMTSLTLPPSTIVEFYCSDTLLQSLDFSHTTFFYNVTLNNNPNLQFVNFKNNLRDYCIPDGINEPCSLPEVVSLQNCPALQTICVDDLSISGVSETAYFQDLVDNPNVSVTTYCSFAPGGGYNTITGNVTIDINGNGCTASDPVAPYTAIGFFSGQDFEGLTSTTANGGYIATTTSNTTLIPVFENPYYSVSPTSFTSAFTGTGNSAMANFCITPNGVHPDLEITLIPITPARPGFNAIYKIHYKNKGTETQSGTVTLAFEDDVLDLVSANPAVSSQTANLLSWDFANLAPFESREIDFTLNVNSPLETPAVNIGDNLDFMATVNSGTDETPNDNALEFVQSVIGSFDPNDKAVSRSVIDIAHLDQYLYYTVRFQNTGTFYAENVVVKDVLSSDLDLSTLQMVSASHPYRATLTIGNKLEFFFEGINLPASADNEPGSHGFVTFKIKPKSTTLWNTDIKNTAEIYFDFNAPIVTNEVTTNVSALGVNDFNGIVANLYPNPAKNNFTVEPAGSNSIEKIIIYNTLGQMLKTIPGNQESEVTVDVSDLQPGTYIVSVETGKGKTNKKLVKL